MKFVDTKGREHRLDIRPSKWKIKDEGRSKIQNKIGRLLIEIFQGDYILEEFSCVGEGLFLDFFMPKSMVAVEVHGPQHYKFIQHFHGTRAGFLQSKARDKRKEEWCRLNKIELVVINSSMKLKEAKKLLIDKKWPSS